MHIASSCPWCSRIQVNDALISSCQAHLPSTHTKNGTWAYPVDLAIFDSFPFFPNLSVASSAGCPFGGFLKDVLSSADVQYQLGDDIRDFEGRFLPFKLVFAYAWGHLGNVDGGLEALRITMHLDTVEGSPRDKEPAFHIVCRVHKTSRYPICCQWLRIERAPPTSQLWDLPAIDWIKHHLAECDGKIGPHSRHCGLDHTKGFLPKRLVDIRYDTLQVSDGADIIASLSTGDSHPHYAALSYCWGSPVDREQQLQLLASSKSEGSFIFDLHDLPIVIRDAITVARSLSLSYLWVDTLCILQDNIHDWEVESSQMDQIYGCSYITICSLTASCNLSFLDPETHTTTIDFQSGINPDIQGQYCISYYYSSSLRSGAGIVVDRLMESRWSRRGWTFQETFLSARLLCFEQSEISFACSDRMAYRSGSIGVRQFESPRQLQDDLRNPQQSVWALWYQLVLTNYCDRIFTHPHDVLPAVSGVASMFNRAFSTRYLAGLWDSDLAVGLMWEVDVERHQGGLLGILKVHHPTNLTALITKLISPPYVSPSWSWAGRQGWINSSIVCYSHIWSDVRNECKLDATVSVEGNNPFGRVEDARITYSGITVTIGPYTRLDPSGRFPGHFKIDLREGGCVIIRLDWYTNGTILRGNFKMILLGSFVEEPEPEDDGLLLAPLSGPGEKLERAAFGLIIHQAPQSESFIRVGVFFSLVSNGGALRYLGSYETETLELI